MPQFAASSLVDFTRTSGYRQRASTQPLREKLKREIRKSREMSQSLKLETDFALAEQALQLASRLKDGWDSYGAPGPSPEAIGRASSFLRDLRAMQFLPSRIVPSAEGGIALYFINKDRVGYVEYRNSGEGLLAMYSPVGEPEIRELGPDTDYRQSVDALRSYLA